jgi:hypothetical protein
MIPRLETRSGSCGRLLPLPSWELSPLGRNLFWPNDDSPGSPSVARSTPSVRIGTRLPSSAKPEAGPEAERWRQEISRSFEGDRFPIPGIELVTISRAPQTKICPERCHHSFILHRGEQGLRRFDILALVLASSGAGSCDRQRSECRRWTNCRTLRTSRIEFRDLHSASFCTCTHKRVKDRIRLGLEAVIHGWGGHERISNFVAWRAYGPDLSF